MNWSNLHHGFPEPFHLIKISLLWRVKLTGDSWHIRVAPLQINNQIVLNPATNHIIVSFDVISPYIINYLTLAIKAKQVYDVLKNEESKQKLSAIVPTQSMIDGNSLTIYELTLDGKIKLLEPYNNMPSDENMLNSILEDTNRKYSEILDIRDDEEEE